MDNNTQNITTKVDSPESRWLAQLEDEEALLSDFCGHRFNICNHPVSWAQKALTIILQVCTLGLCGKLQSRRFEAALLEGDIVKAGRILDAGWVRTIAATSLDGLSERKPESLGWLLYRIDQISTSCRGSCTLDFPVRWQHHQHYVNKAIRSNSLKNFMKHVPDGYNQFRSTAIKLALHAQPHSLALESFEAISGEHYVSNSILGNIPDDLLLENLSYWLSKGLTRYSRILNRVLARDDERAMQELLETSKLSPSQLKNTLKRALFYGSTRVARYLQDTGVADLSREDKQEIASKINQRIDEDVYPKSSRITCRLERALEKQNVSKVKRLLELGADPNIQLAYWNKHGDVSKYSCMAAANWDSPGLIELLLQYGGKLTAGNFNALLRTFNDSDYSGPHRDRPPQFLDPVGDEIREGIHQSWLDKAYLMAFKRKSREWMKFLKDLGANTTKVDDMVEAAREIVNTRRED